MDSVIKQRFKTIFFSPVVAWLIVLLALVFDPWTQIDPFNTHGDNEAVHYHLLWLQVGLFLLATIISLYDLGNGDCWNDLCFTLATFCLICFLAVAVGIVYSFVPWITGQILTIYSLIAEFGVKNILTFATTVALFSCLSFQLCFKNRS